MSQAFDPDDRYVVLAPQVTEKILREHPDMADYLDEILATAAHPDLRESDPYERARRERFNRRDVGPRRVVRVVVEYEGTVVTAFSQDNDPEWTPQSP